MPATVSQLFRYPVKSMRGEAHATVDIPDSDHPFLETQWLGQRVKIGDVELDIVGDCPRCSMTTHAFGDLPADPEIMRTLVEACNGNVGVYAKVVSAGTLNIGDALG
ncbi:Uncharacterised protein [Halioglobus japonicus]|nr:Uncharacterised protein [Halioglobus japonicus]